MSEGVFQEIQILPPKKCVCVRVRACAHVCVCSCHVGPWYASGWKGAEWGHYGTTSERFVLPPEGKGGAERARELQKHLPPRLKAPLASESLGHARPVPLPVCGRR